MKKFIFILVTLITIPTFSQALRKNIRGVVVNDSIRLNNIHIINKNIKLGVATDKTGKFILPVKLNDTLIISSVQFEHKIIVIKKQDLNDDNVLSIKLQPQAVNLDEIEIFSHKMIGNLAIDGSKFKNNTILKTNYLDFSRVDLDNLIKNDRYKNFEINNKAMSTKTNSNYVSGGVDFLKVAKMLKGKKNHKFEISSKKERKKMLSDIIYTSKKIRTDVNDDFFTKTLEIPKDKINDFLFYAIDDRIVNLYNSNKKLEVIAYLIKLAPVYLKLQN